MMEGGREIKRTEECTYLDPWEGSEVYGSLNSNGMKYALGDHLPPSPAAYGTPALHGSG